MEGDSVDWSVVGIVVLDEFTKPGIPDFDCAIDGRSSYAGTIRRELATEDFGLVLCEGCGDGGLCDVP